MAEEVAAAHRQLGRAAGVGHRSARHDQRLPRLHARSGAADVDRLRVLVHARVDHPGGQTADGDRARRGRHQRADAAVAPVRQPVRLHQAVGGDDRAHLHDVRAAQGLHLRRLDRVPRRLRDLAALSLLLLLLSRPERRQDPVADSLGGADARRLPGRHDWSRRRRDLRHPQAARGHRSTACAGSSSTGPRIRTSSWSPDGGSRQRLDRHPRLQRIWRDCRRRAGAPRGGALARDSGHRRRLDRRHGRRRRGRRRARRAPSVQQGQRRRGQNRNSHRHRRVRPDHRRRRPAPAGRRAASDVARSASTISSSARDRKRRRQDRRAGSATPRSTGWRRF